MTRLMMRLTKAGPPLDPPPKRNRKRWPYAGTVRWRGHLILIENAAGSYREGKDADGKPWRIRLGVHYGEFEGTKGVDGDALDVFLGPDLDAPRVYIIRQKIPGEDGHDEDKCAVGFRTKAAAEAAYRSMFDRPGFLMDVLIMTAEEFDRWLSDSTNRGVPVTSDLHPDLPLAKSAPRLMFRQPYSQPAGWSTLPPPPTEPPSDPGGAAWPPKGAGWQPIPGGTKGGYRKRDGKGGWLYAYPPEQAAPQAKAPAAPTLRIVPAEEVMPRRSTLARRPAAQRVETFVERVDELTIPEWTWPRLTVEQRRAEALLASVEGRKEPKKKPGLFARLRGLATKIGVALGVKVEERPPYLRLLDAFGLAPTPRDLASVSDLSDEELDARIAKLREILGIRPGAETVDDEAAPEPEPVEVDEPAEPAEAMEPREPAPPRPKTDEQILRGLARQLLSSLLTERRHRTAAAAETRHATRSASSAMGRAVAHIVEEEAKAPAQAVELLERFGDPAYDINEWGLAGMTQFLRGVAGGPYSGKHPFELTQEQRDTVAHLFKAKYLDACNKGKLSTIPYSDGRVGWDSLDDEAFEWRGIHNHLIHSLGEEQLSRLRGEVAAPAAAAGPTPAPAVPAAVAPAPPVSAEPVHYTHTGISRRDAAPDAGTVFYDSRRKRYMIVTSVGKPYYVEEDGLSFGLRDDRGWAHHYTAQEATEEEARSLRTRREAAISAKGADEARVSALTVLSRELFSYNSPGGTYDEAGASEKIRAAMEDGTIVPAWGEPGKSNSTFFVVPVDPTQPIIHAFYGASAPIGMVSRPYSLELAQRLLDLLPPGSEPRKAPKAIVEAPAPPANPPEARQSTAGQVAQLAQDGAKPEAIYLVPVEALSLPAGQTIDAPHLPGGRTPDSSVRTVAAPANPTGPRPDAPRTRKPVEEAVDDASVPEVDTDLPEAPKTPRAALTEGFKRGPERPEDTASRQAPEGGVDYAALQTAEQLRAHIEAVRPYGIRKGWGKVTRTANNATAKALSARLRESGATPTPTERETLIGYTGRGGFGESINEFYTPANLIAAMWAGVSGALQPGAQVLEPSCATGAFIEHAPAGVHVTGVELEADSGQIAALLHPDQEIQLGSFEHFSVLDTRRFDAVIGNPPFGDRGGPSLIDPVKRKMMGQEYGLDTALDKARDGALVAMVIPRGILDNEGEAGRAFRERISAKGEVVSVHRLPSGSFKPSPVVTDVIVLRKRPQAVANVALAAGEAGVSVDERQRLGILDEEFLEGTLLQGERGAVLGVEGKEWQGQTKIIGTLDPATLAQLALDIRLRVAAPPTGPQTIASVVDAGFGVPALVAAHIPYMEPEGTTKTVEGITYVLRDLSGTLVWRRIDDAAELANSYTKLEASAIQEAESLGGQIRNLQRNAANGTAAVRLINKMRETLAAEIVAWRDAHGNPQASKRLLKAVAHKANANAFLHSIGADGELSPFIRHPIGSDSPELEAESKTFADAAERVSRATGGLVSPGDIAQALGDTSPEKALAWLYQSPDHALEADGQWVDRPEYLSGNLLDKRDRAERDLALAESALAVQDSVLGLLRGGLKTGKMDPALTARKIAEIEQLPRVVAKLGQQMGMLNETLQIVDLEDVEVTLKSRWIPDSVLQDYARTGTGPATYATLEIKFDGGQYHFLRNGVELDPKAAGWSDITENRPALALYNLLNGHANPQRSGGSLWDLGQEWATAYTGLREAKGKTGSRYGGWLHDLDDAEVQELVDGKWGGPAEYKGQVRVVKLPDSRGYESILGFATMAGDVIDFDEKPYTGKKWKALDALYRKLHGKKIPDKADRKDPLFRVAQEWEAAFREWVLTSEHRDALEATYNRKFNNWHKRTESREPLDLPGWDHGKWKEDPKTGKRKHLSGGYSPHGFQNQAVRFARREESCILADGVGLGKTTEAIALLTQLRSVDATKKQLIGVPKGVIWNWRNTHNKLVPGAKILVIGETEIFDKNGEKTGTRVDDIAARAAKWARVAAEDFDLVIASHGAIGQVPLGLETQMRVWTEEYNDDSANAEKSDEKRAKDLDAERKRLLAMDASARDAGMPEWEELGIDCLMFDEAHNFKNQYIPKTRGGKPIKYLGGGGMSQRGMDIKAKTHAFRGQTGGKHLFFLSATPVKNSPLELFTMLSMIAPEELRLKGLDNHEAFIERFAKIEDLVVLNTKAEPIIAPCVVGFKNVRELRKMTDKLVLLRDAKDVGLPQPRATQVEHVLKMTPDQDRVYQLLRQEFEDLIEALKQAKVRAATAAESGQDDSQRAMMEGALKEGDQKQPPMLKLITDMLKTTMDPSLVSERILSAAKVRDRTSPKIEALVSAIVSKWKGDKDSGQIIFSDLKAIHHTLRARLIAEGIPADAIALLNADAAHTAGDRQAIADDYNDTEKGKLRIIIGTTAVAGEGIDLQMRTTDIHHADIPWDPATLEQRNGRGVRQGNPNDEVKIHHYIADGSFDAYKQSAISGKGDWMYHLWHGTSDEVEIPPEERGFTLEQLVMIGAKDKAKALKELNDKKAEKMAELARRKAADAVDLYRSLQRRWTQLRNLRAKKRPDPLLIAKAERGIASLRKSLQANEYFPWKAALNDLDNTFAFVSSQGDGIVSRDMILKSGGDFYLVRSVDTRTGALIISHATGGSSAQTFEISAANLLRSYEITEYTAADKEELIFQSAAQKAVGAYGAVSAALEIPRSLREKRRAEVGGFMAEAAKYNKGAVPGLRKSGDGRWRLAFVGGSDLAEGIKQGFHPYLNTDEDRSLLRAARSDALARLEAGEPLGEEALVFAAYDTWAQALERDAPGQPQVSAQPADLSRPAWLEYARTAGVGKSGRPLDDEIAGRMYRDALYAEWTAGRSTWERLAEELPEADREHCLRKALAAGDQAIAQAAKDPMFGALQAAVEQDKTKVALIRRVQLIDPEFAPTIMAYHEESGQVLVIKPGRAYSLINGTPDSPETKIDSLWQEDNNLPSDVRRIPLSAISLTEADVRLSEVAQVAGALAKEAAARTAQEARTVKLAAFKDEISPQALKYVEAFMAGEGVGPGAFSSQLNVNQRSGKGWSMATLSLPRGAPPVLASAMAGMGWAYDHGYQNYKSPRGISLSSAVSTANRVKDEWDEAKLVIEQLKASGVQKSQEPVAAPRRAPRAPVVRLTFRQPEERLAKTGPRRAPRAL